MALILSEDQSKQLWDLVLADADNLAPLPEVACRIIQEIDNPKSTPLTLEKIIRNDPTLTAKVLKMANSAFYGYPKKINTTAQAIIILGLNTLKSIVFAALAYSSLCHAVTGYGMEAEVLYRMGLATAVASGLLCKHTQFQEREKVFVASILHDLGKMVLGNKIAAYMDDIVACCEEKGFSFDIAERHVLGFNQNDVGAVIAQRWGLPRFIEDCCRFYHEPHLCNSDNADMVEIVHLADSLMRDVVIYQSVDWKKYSYLKNIFKKYNLHKQMRRSLVKELRKDYEEVYVALVNE